MNPHEPINNLSIHLSDEQRDWIELTLLNHREGMGSIAEAAKLRDLLLVNQEARNVYLRFNQLDCQLQAATTQALAPATIPPTQRAFHLFRPAHLVSALVGAGMAAAIIFLISMGSSTEVSKKENQAQVSTAPLASLYSDYDAHYSGTATTSEKSFKKGALSLDQGIAQLNFRNGAQIVLEGKCGFEIINDMTVMLTHGKMWAHCPPEAHGFKVITPGGREVIDLGTEFGIEVSPQGTTNVHVFDGLVNVIDPHSGSQEITAGKAVRWNPGSTTHQNKQADYKKFVTSTDLTHKRLRAHHDEMLKRDDLLLYYDFTKIKGNQILNKAPNAPESSHGTIIKANRVSGRFSSNGAVQFERRGSGIQLELERPENVRQFTMAIWVNVSQLPTALSTLINSNDWDAGDIHFQITRTGGLRTGLKGGMAYESHSGIIQVGQWHLLATTWNLDTQTTKLFCNGKPAAMSGKLNHSIQSSTTDFQWGDCMIGTWQTSGKYKNEIRDLKGRIDEVMIFNRGLSQQEMMELYQSGRP